MKKIYVLSVCLLACFTVFAQPEGVGMEPATNDVPLDGGLLVLAVAGTVYGARKKRKG